MILLIINARLKRIEYLVKIFTNRNFTHKPHVLCALELQDRMDTTEITLKIVIVLNTADFGWSYCLRSFLVVSSSLH